MNEELARVDKLLDDDRLFAPFRERFGTRIGRPTTAVATFLRLMVLCWFRPGFSTGSLSVCFAIAFSRAFIFSVISALTT